MWVPYPEEHLAWFKDGPKRFNCVIMGIAETGMVTVGCSVGVLQDPVHPKHLALNGGGSLTRDAAAVPPQKVSMQLFGRS